MKGIFETFGKVLKVLQKVQFVTSIVVPILEQALNKDINNDGKIGRATEEK